KRCSNLETLEPTSSWQPVMEKLLPTTSWQFTWFAVARKLPVCHAPDVVWKVVPAASVHATESPIPFPQFQVPDVINPTGTVTDTNCHVLAVTTEYSIT